MNDFAFFHTQPVQAGFEIEFDSELRGGNGWKGRIHFFEGLEGDEFVATDLVVEEVSDCGEEITHRRDFSSLGDDFEAGLLNEVLGFVQVVGEGKGKAVAMLDELLLILVGCFGLHGARQRFIRGGYE